MVACPDSCPELMLTLRIARPVSDLERTSAMYAQGLGLTILGSFQGHAGFDGVFLGLEGSLYHFEFTTFPAQPIIPRPTHEDLIVFYFPEHCAWQEACSRMIRAGFQKVVAGNPYWAAHGTTFEDLDGYRTVLVDGPWPAKPSTQSLKSGGP